MVTAEITYPLPMVSCEAETDFLIEWQDSMTDDTYAEMFASRGEVRDVDYARNMETLRERLTAHAERVMKENA